MENNSELSAILTQVLSQLSGNGQSRTGKNVEVHLYLTGNVVIGNNNKFKKSKMTNKGLNR